MLTTSKFNLDFLEAKYGSWTYWAGLSYAFPFAFLCKLVIIGRTRRTYIAIVWLAGRYYMEWN